MNNAKLITFLNFKYVSGIFHFLKSCENILNITLTSSKIVKKKKKNIVFFDYKLHPSITHKRGSKFEFKLLPSWNYGTPFK